MVHLHRQRGEEGATAPLQPQEVEETSLITENTQTFTDAKSSASCWAVSPPSTATALPTTAGLSRRWCGLHSALLGANYLPSRTPTAPDVTGRPKRLSSTTTTRATACSPRYHPKGKVSTGASKLGPRDLKTSQGHQTVKKPSLDGYHPVTQPCTLEAATLCT